MPQFIGLLRAINAGRRRVVKMASLRQLFESLGFSSVTTFITSGNVVFESRATSVKRLERRIEKRLHDALGYDVPVFIRTESELSSVVRFRPFLRSSPSDDLNIIFLATPLDDEARQRVVALTSATDQFRVRRREIYWLRRKKPGTSLFSTVPLERILGRRFTIRGARTVKHLAQKCRERR